MYYIIYITPSQVTGQSNENMNWFNKKIHSLPIFLINLQYFQVFQHLELSIKMKIASVFVMHRYHQNLHLHQKKTLNRKDKHRQLSEKKASMKTFKTKTLYTVNNSTNTWKKTCFKNTKCIVSRIIVLFN